MKKYALVFMLVVVSALLYIFTTRPATQYGTQSTITQQQCLADDCLAVDGLEYPAAQLPEAVKNALARALDDEYKAHATYQAVIAKLGSVRPFAMIIGAEEQHIASLRALYAKYGLPLIEDHYTGKVDAPATLSAACQLGVTAEIANAQLYKDELLPQVASYPDIQAVFTNLMTASESKHLPAFTRCATR